MKETTMKISALAALIAVLSTFAASGVQAGGAPGSGVNWHSGGNAAANGKSQGQKGGGVRYAGGRTGGGGEV